MKQYLIICYQHESEGSFIVDDLIEFIKEYNCIEDESKIQENIDWLLDKNKSEHEVYELYNNKLTFISKVWYKTVIATEEQNVEIYPTESFDGIIVETKELDDKAGNPRLYLNKDEMELLIIKMQEMMNYVLEK